MAQVAVCPECDHEFVAPSDIGDGGWVDCPACNASFSLDDMIGADEPSAASRAGAPAASLDDSDDTTARRIEKWFHSSETVADVRPDSLKNADPELAHVGAPPESGPPASESDRGDATIEFGPDALANAGGDDFDDGLILGETNELADESAPWDDQEHMERLLADIEGQPTDDFLPVSRETRATIDETVGDEVAGDDLELEDAPAYDHATAATDEHDYSSDPAESDAAANDLPEAFTPRGGSRPRRRTSVVRMLVSSAITGVLGLAIGYFVLLWCLGPNGDFLKVAKHLPGAILPASFHENNPKLANDPAQKPAADSGDSLMAGTERAVEGGVVNAAGDNSGDANRSAEVQANFETPAVPNGGKTTAMTDNRYAIPPPTTNAPTAGAMEPARMEERPAAPLPAASALAPRIQGAPTYTADQLATVLGAARDAERGLVDGDLNDRAVQKAKGQSYSKLCDLAEAATFVDSAMPERSVATAADMRSDVEQLFRQVLADSRIRGEVARIVPIWVDSPNRRHGGIFFAGAVVGHAERGTVTECQIDTGDGASLTVLVSPALAAQLGNSNRPIGVVGSLVEKPGERISGYTGTAPRAVWASSLIRLGQ